LGAKCHRTAGLSHNCLHRLANLTTSRCLRYSKLRIIQRAVSRFVYRYEPKPGDDSPIIKGLLGLANRYPRYGFGKLFAVLRRQV
jgi:hypothetical protein